MPLVDRRPGRSDEKEQSHAPTPSASFLQRALIADAVVSGAAGLLLLLGAGLLSEFLGLPGNFLRIAGLLLVAFAAVVAYLARRQDPPPAAVRALVAINLLWVADSLLLLVTDWVEPTGFGYAFVLTQALVVALFAELQVLGLRRVRPAAALPTGG